VCAEERKDVVMLNASSDSDNPYQNCFDLLSLFGCWYYWNNHCSLVVVKGILSDESLFSHPVRSHSMVSLAASLHRQTEEKRSVIVA
jgi:hypothetical protein